MSGLFGVVAADNCSEILFYGTDYQSHLGTEYGGMVVLGDEFVRQIHDLSQSQFQVEVLRRLPQDGRQQKASAVISACDEQPIYLNSRFGPFCLATAGSVENRRGTGRPAFEEGNLFRGSQRKGINTTELIGKLINQGTDLVDGIERMFSLIEGSCSLLLLNRTGIYVARDRFGYTPFVVGRSADTWAVTSESSAFPNLGFEAIKCVEPRRDPAPQRRRHRSAQTGRKHNRQTCTFLWIYTGFPASDYEGINVEIVRERAVDVTWPVGTRISTLTSSAVCPIPDWPMGSATPWNRARPFRRPLVKYTPGYRTQPTRPLRRRPAIESPR